MKESSYRTFSALQMMLDFSKRIPASIFLFSFFFSIYLFTMSGQIAYGDEIERYRVAQSIVERYNLTIRHTQHRNTVGIGGQSYSPLEIGQTVLQVPLYVMGRALYAFFPVIDINHITILVVGLLNPFLTALTCVILFQTCSLLEFRQRTSLVLTLLYGLGTIAWPYSRGFLREPLITLLIMVSLYTTLSFQKTGYRLWLIITGIVLGFLVSVKFLESMLVPFFYVYIISATIQKRFESQQGVKAPLLIKYSLLLFIPIIMSWLLLGAYSLARYGMLDVGFSGAGNGLIPAILQRLSFSTIGQAIVGLLLSPEKSIFFYSPVTLIALVAYSKWVKRSKREALLFLSLILVTFVTTIIRFDWNGGSWWGPRYLAPITPLLIIPIGALEQECLADNRICKAFLALLFIIGLFVQFIGALSSDRTYLDITGKYTSLVGQIDFLSHGALDSLVIYLSPTSWLIQINPYGILLICVVALLGIVIVWRVKNVNGSYNTSTLLSGSFLALILAIEMFAFIIWIVAPYPRILAARANTKLVAANSFLADARKCEAIAMDLMAIEQGTTYQRDSIARVNELRPRTSGMEISTDQLYTWIEAPENAVIRKVEVTNFREVALEINLPQGQNEIARTISSKNDVLPSETYELSGWIQTENVYGLGYAVISVYEDDGNWDNRRNTDITSLDETIGWRQFRKRITTLPTTQRILIIVSLWKTYGTVRVAGLQLAHLTNNNGASSELPAACN